MKNTVLALGLATLSLLAATPTLAFEALPVTGPAAEYVLCVDVVAVPPARTGVAMLTTSAAERAALESRLKHEAKEDLKQTIDTAALLRQTRLDARPVVHPLQASL